MEEETSEEMWRHTSAKYTGHRKQKELEVDTKIIPCIICLQYVCAFLY